MCLEGNFWSRVDIQLGTDECWEWTGARLLAAGTGYGRIRVGNRTMMAHRVVIELTTGQAVPDDMQVDHLCYNHACVNPAHLEVVTMQENIRRRRPYPSWQGSKTHCKQGHPYDEANTILRKQGGRDCRACNRKSARASRARQKVIA